MADTSNDSVSRKSTVFLAVMILCAQFLLLTTAAMFFQNQEGGYSFFHDFFSELGQTETAPGRPNTVSFVLFNLSLGLAGIGLILFFVAFARMPRARGLSMWAARAGAVVGVVSGFFFISVAFTPMNLVLALHETCFYLAFLSFPLAALLATVAILKDGKYPNRYALIFGVFTLMLFVYLGLIMLGPDEHTASGKAVQATGQKLIGYAAILSVFVQAWGARRLARNR